MNFHMLTVKEKGDWLSHPVTQLLVEHLKGLHVITQDEALRRLANGETEKAQAAAGAALSVGEIASLVTWAGTERNETQHTTFVDPASLENLK